jgi:signal transduction histidine kinase
MIEQRPPTSRYRSLDENPASLLGIDPRVLLASIIHDFNNFLTPIVSIMEELQRQEAVSPRQLKRIDGAVFCAFRAQTLARQLLDLASSRELRLEPVHISQLLEVLEPVLGGVLPGQITIRFDVADDLPPAFIDRQLMERALLNLVLNARDAMPDGGELIVAAAIDPQPGKGPETREPMIRLSVVDTGIGMNPETLRSAGRAYFSTKPYGTGLGLAMASRLMESQGGVLSISSIPHHGTVIDLWLPTMPSPTPADVHITVGGRP